MKSLVVLSGGMDSATALTLAVKTFGREKVSAVSFNYGSKHNTKENQCAQLLSSHYGISHKLVHLPFINDLFKSDLLKTGGEIPEGHYAEENMKKTVVPFRNGIMLAIATGYAESIDSEQVIIGNHSGDHAVYPDCREDFMTPFGRAIEKGTWKGIHLYRPFEHKTKGQIAAMGIEMGTPYEMTWSCYKGGEVHCGRCGTCVERLESFDQAGVKDPVAYSDRTYYREVLKSAEERKILI